MIDTKKQKEKEPEVWKILVYVNKNANSDH